MKAVIQKRYGSHRELELREVGLPDVGDDEVLVRVHAASLHPDVWHVVCGRPAVLRLMGGGLLRPKHPIPGTDMAGVVDRVGRQVSRFRPGDPVFGETLTKHQWVHGGAYAEYVAVPQDNLAPKPGNVTYEQAASVPSSGYIALMNLRDRSRLQPGNKVLINGAGGGVGSLALQIIKAEGGHVTAVDGTGKLEMLRTLGADEVIDYTRVDYTTTGREYDLVFDIPGDRPFREIRPALHPDGRYVMIGHDHYGRSGRQVFGLIPHFLKLMFMSRFVKQLRGPGIKPPARGEVMERLGTLLETGKLTPIIDRAYPLDEVREAFRHMMEDELQGKVVLTVP